MKDIMGLMKQAKEMQSKMQSMQDELANVEAEGVAAAHNQAKSKVEEITAEKTAELTSGLPLPPGMKLPFG